MENQKDFLEKQLERVDKWLHFAEAKNAALIAFNVAILGMEFPEKMLCLEGVTKVLFAISIVIAICSFWPNLSNVLIRKWKFKSNINANNLYFSDIAGYLSEIQYLDMVNEKYYEKRIQSFSDIEKDFAREILMNSQITVVKYGLFRIALIGDVIGTILLSALLIGA